MNYFKYCIIISVIMVLFSCGKKQKINDGFKTYNNSTKPGDPNFSIEIIQQDTLQNDSTGVMFDAPWEVVTDKNGYIYILSFRNAKIVKFDSELNFVCDFGGSGNGPGEMQSPQSMFIFEDSLYVADVETRKINKFLKDGTFINSVNAPVLTSSVSFLQKDNFVLSQVCQDVFRKEERWNSSKLTLLDNHFNKLHDIVDYGETKDGIFLFTKISYAATDSIIYVAENRSDKYKINCYDFSGRKTGIINKNYSMIPFVYKKDVWKKYFRSNYKRSISNLYMDYDDNLWVMKAVEERLGKDNIRDSFVFDVFKDGKFINEIKFDNLEYDPFNYGLKTKIIGDRIFSLYMGEEKVMVSKYKIKIK